MEPRKPKIDLITNYERKGIEFYVKDPETYLDKKYQYPEETPLLIGQFIFRKM